MRLLFSFVAAVADSVVLLNELNPCVSSASLLILSLMLNVCGDCSFYICYYASVYSQEYPLLRYYVETRKDAVE
jgi:hypothetical protein